MDNPKPESSQELSAWVKSCSDLLAPPDGWEPNVNAALARFEDRAGARLRWRSGTRRCLMAGAMAALLACIAVPIVPRASAYAQQAGNTSWRRLEQFWYWVTVVQRTPPPLGMLPYAVKALHTQPGANPSGAREVADAAEAALRAGFAPRLPDSTVLSGPPRLSVLGPMSFASVIGTAELAGLLRKAGAPDGQVPQSWNGARLRLQIGATMVASWRSVKEQASGGTAWSGLTLVQGPAPVVTAPAGFDLQAFASAALQAAGMRDRNRAARLAQQATTAPALLAGYLTPYFYVDVREVNLRAGAATLVEEYGLASQEDRFGYSDGFPRMERLSLLWIARDRVYLLSGGTQTPPRMLSGDLAAALRCMIDLANTI